jgi:hypothetical protein
MSISANHQLHAKVCIPHIRDGRISLQSKLFQFHYHALVVHVKINKEGIRHKVKHSKLLFLKIALWWFP